MITAPSGRFLNALAGSHERHVRLTLFTYNDSGVLESAGPVDIISGTLSIDASLAAWRRFTGRVVLPVATSHALEGRNTFNGELKIEIGIGFIDGVDWVQVAQLRVEESSRIAAKVGGTITAFDRAVRVNDFPFITPYAPRDMNGNQLTAVAAIRDIITTAFPSNSPPVFVVDPALDQGLLPPPETTFTGARWDAVLKLAESLGAMVYNDNLGRFVIAPSAVADAPVTALQGGSGGTLVEDQTTSTRVDQYNAVGLTSESPSGDGIFVYVVDNDPASPTYYDGPFGRKPFMTRNDTLSTADAAIATARALLARKKSAARDLALTAVYNPLLQPMDVVEVVEPAPVYNLLPPEVARLDQGTWYAGSTAMTSAADDWAASYTATAAGDVALTFNKALAAEAAALETYTVQFEVKRTVGGSVIVQQEWLDIVGGSLGTAPATTVAGVGNAYVLARHAAKSPGSTAKVRSTLVVKEMAAGETVTIRRVGVWAGSVGQWAMPIEPESHVIDSMELSLSGAKMSLRTHLWAPEPTVLVATVGGRSVL